MKTAALGATGIEISRVGFGSWALSGPNSPSFWGPQDDEVSIGTIRHCVEAGANWIDTAAVYGMGHAERLVARALEPYSDADRPYVFTKGGLLWDEPGPGATLTRSGRPESLRRELEASLERLGVERIDLYQMHWPADDVSVEEYWPVFVEFLESGKVRAIGLSNHSAEQRESALAAGPVHTDQVPLSLIRPGALDEEIPWARANGVAVLAYSPQGSGLLTGKFSADRLESLDPGDWRRRSPLFTPDNLVKVDALVAVLAEIAAGHHTTVSAVAIAWALSQGGVTAAIVGARTPGQVDDWLGAGEVELSDEELVALESARGRYAGD